MEKTSRKSLGDYVPEFKHWVCLEFFDHRSSSHHAWMIPPEAFAPWLGALPPLARIEASPVQMANTLAWGVVRAFLAMHPEASEHSLHLCKSSLGQQDVDMAWAQLAVETTPAPGWGTDETVEFVDGVVMESYPEAVAFRGVDMAGSSDRNAMSDHHLIFLLPQASAIHERRVLAAVASGEAQQGVKRLDVGKRI